MTTVDDLVVHMHCDEIVLPNAKLIKIPDEDAYMVVPLNWDGEFEPSGDVPPHTHYSKDILDFEEAVLKICPGFTGEITMDQVIGLVDELNKKSNVGHVHTMSEISGLDEKFDTKSDVGHKHEIDDVSGLETALGTKSNIGHGHMIDDINGLIDELSVKADQDHGHDVNIVNFNMDCTQLAHTHAASDITDFEDKVKQIIAANTNNAVENYSHNETITWSKDGVNTSSLEMAFTEENLNITVTILDNETEKENFEVTYADISDGKMIIGDYILVYQKDSKIEFVPEFYEGTYTVTIAGTLDSTSSVNNTYTCSVTQSGTDMDSKLITAKAVEDYVLAQNYAPKNHMHNIQEIYGFDEILSRISAIEAKLKEFHPE